MARKRHSGAPKGSKNHLLKSEPWITKYDLDSVDGLQALLKEVVRRVAEGRMAEHRGSMIRAAVRLLLKTFPGPVPVAVTIDEGPVVWLESTLGFRPFKHQAQLLNDWQVKTRIVLKSRQVGVTTALAMEAIYKAFTASNRVILIVSPSDRQSKILMGRIQVAVDGNPALSGQVTRKNTTELWLKNGSSIISLPNNPDRIRGYSATDIILDEAAQFLNDERMLASIKPMLAATGGSFTVASTPKGKRGLFYDQYRLAVSEQSSRNDIRAYDMCPSSISPLISNDYLEGERLNLSELEFQQEYEGQFVEVVDTYIVMNTIMACVDSQLRLLTQGEPSSKYLLGLDLAKQKDESVVILLERLRDGVLVVRYIAAWSKMDYSEQLGRLRLVASQFKITGGCVDQTGVGQPIVDELKTVIPNIVGINFTQQSKVDLASGLLTLLEQRKLRLPNDKKLIMQLNGLRYRVSRNGSVLFESPEKDRLHDDYLWALALACHACKNNYAPLTLIIW
jgi:phage FluMu gp28-like protein